MGLTPNEQFKSLIEKSENILILLPQNPNGDAIGAGRALSFYLKNKNKESSLAFTDQLNTSDRFSFLPEPKNEVQNIIGARDFILSFNTKYNKILDVRTERLDNELRIYITPERGSIDPRDFSFIPAQFKFDLVICLNAPDKESFGKIYEENPDIFFEVPVINIDHHNNNENFGQINLVDIMASSSSEILAGIISSLDGDKLDKDISHCLLTGIIDATESFQNKKTTPKSLQISSLLMDRGADQQEIIRHLYKTQPLQFLKLWGRTMAKLNWDPELKLVWSTVSIEDFVQSRTTPADIPFILGKLKNNYSSGKIFLILYHETADIIKGIIKVQHEDDIKKMNTIEQGKTTNDIYEFALKETDISKAEKEIIQKLKTELK